MEEQLLDILEATNTKTSMNYSTVSRFNQPERILVSSQQATDGTNTTGATDQQLTTYSFFSVSLPRPCYGVKSLQLLRASIPNITTNIPDGQTTLWYYRTNNPNVTIPSLYMVRLLPSWYKTEVMKTGNTYGQNRSFTDYTDLAAELALSCINDPITNLSGQDYFLSGDVTISYNSVKNKFVFTGNTAGYTYSVAPPTDPAVVARAAQLLIDSAAYDTGLTNVPGQPFTGTLGYRLGFTNAVPYSTSLSTTPAHNNAYWELWRPIPSFVSQGGQTVSSYSYTADNYADLVNTNIVSFYADIVGGSSTDSSKNTNLLACVPVATQNLGVAFFQTSLNNPLTKVSSEFDCIRIEMRDDYGNPFLIPNSAVVSLEIALTY